MRADVVGQRQPRHGELDEVTELKVWGRSRPQADRLAGHIIRPWARDSLRGVTVTASERGIPDLHE